MKSPLILLLVCWSSIALALGDPNNAGGPGQPQSPKKGHTPMSLLLRSCSDPPQTSLFRTTSSPRYNPWVEQVTGLPSGAVVGPIHAVDSNTVWVSVGGETRPAVIRTTNGGTTWICDTIKIAPTNYAISGVFALDASRCWLVMYDATGPTSGGLYRTTDSGVTWTQDTTAFKTTGGFPDHIHFFDANNGVTVGDPNNDGYFEIYTTSNGGASWSRVPQANIPPPLTQEYGSYWIIPGAAGNSLWFPTYNDAGSTGRYYKTTDRGLTWSVHVYPGAPADFVLKLAFQDKNVGLGNGGYGEVSRTTDGGSNWSRVPIPSTFQFFDRNFEYVPGTSGMYVGGAVYWGYPSLQDGSILGTAYTTDGGASWTEACALSCPNFFMDFASVSAGWRTDYSGPNVYKWSMAKGQVIGTSIDTLRFVTVASGKTSDTVAIDAVNFGSDSLTVSSIVAPGNQYIVVSQPNLPALLPYLGSVRIKLCFAPNKNGVLQDSLVFVSNAANAQRTSVYLQGTGTGATAIEPASAMPKAFALMQNYPNPFNPSTTIRYSLPHKSQVLLTVYNTLGQEVASLVNGDIDAGYHEVKFDGSTLASGVYFYRLQTGTFVDTKKLLLLR